MTLYRLLTFIHITAGGIALGTALGATLVKGLNLNHHWHVISGRIYVWSMIVISLTAFPMAIIHPNTFLILIGIFSLYLTLAGWRYATNRKGRPRRFDWISSGLMLLTSLVMIGMALYKMMDSTTSGILLLIFGTIGSLLSGSDLKRLKAGGVKGKPRVAAHLIMMLSATIATLTAFLVNNITMQPTIVPWLAPTVVIVPIIVLWSRSVQKSSHEKS